MRTYESIEVAETMTSACWARKALEERVESNRLTMVAESGRQVVSSTEFRQVDNRIECEARYAYSQDGKAPSAEEVRRGKAIIELNRQAVALSNVAKRAIAEEREACARIADIGLTNFEIAAAIRARGNNQREEDENAAT